MDAKGPETIGEIISRLFAARGWGRKQERLRLERAWAEAVGPEQASNTRVAAIRRNILEIEVRGAVLFQELAQFHKRRLLEALRKLLPGVTIADLRFRSGAWQD
jgi:predicted nucleic acid-binding Zn ribbon protein